MWDTIKVGIRQGYGLLNYAKQLLVSIFIAVWYSPTVLTGQLIEWLNLYCQNMVGQKKI